MKHHTIKQLADMAGVTVRTLHHYDQIGLLRPHKRSKNNYRYYGDYELMRLQQILFYRELNYELEDIKVLLDRPSFDLKVSLELQREALVKKQARLALIQKTLDQTLIHLTQNTMMTDDQLYAGFKDGKKYRKEASQRWGEDVVKKSEARVRALGSEEFEQVKKEGDAITHKLADLMNQDPASVEVQEAIALFHRHMSHYIEEIPLAVLRGWGQMYVDDPRFRANYDKYKVGLAEFLNKAIQIYCDR